MYKASINFKWVFFYYVSTIGQQPTTKNEQLFPRMKFIKNLFQIASIHMHIDFGGSDTFVP